MPQDAYLEAIVSDLADARAELEKKPVYTLLNMCRVWQYVAENAISSKLEGGSWALAHLSGTHQQVVGKAVRAYRAGTAFTCENSLVHDVVHTIGNMIATCQDQEKNLANQNDFML